MKKHFVFLLAICSVFSLAGCSTFMNKDNATPPSPLVNFVPTAEVQTLWHVKAGNGSGGNYVKLTPAVYHHTVFTGDVTGNVTAVNTKDGRILWQIGTRIPITSGMMAASGKIFAGTGVGTVLALNAENGQILWQTEVGNQVLATPTVYQDKVLVKSIDGALTALSRTDGRTLWQFHQNVPSLILHASSQPQVAGNYVVAGFANGKVAVLKVQNGEPLWIKSVAEATGATEVERMVDIDMSPVVINGIVYVATYQGNIVALNLKTGDLIWKHKISSHAGLTADHQRIYLSDTTDYVWAFNEEVGAVQWRQTALTGREITGPALLNDKVIVGDSAGYLHWLSKNDGKFVARNQLDNTGVLSTPVVSDNVAYVYTRMGNLFALQVV